MNGVDPAPQDIALENGFFTQHKVKVFGYNQQVVDALTTSIRQTALKAGVPVVGVYETMPTPGYDYQSWMLAEVNAIQKAVAGQDLDPEAVMTDQATDRRRRAREILRVDGVSVSLSGRQILDEVSFTVGAGEFTGLIGPNGAGKTTLLRVILGLQRPTGGEVAVLGEPRSPAQPVHRLRPAEGPPRPGHADAGPGPGRARAGRAPLRHAGCAPGSAGEAVGEMLHAVDAERFADARVGNLSGGEQQRVLIAHALISRPQLLLLDEPLANLDLAQRPGDRQPARPHRPRAADRRAAVRPRDEPAAAGDGPRRLPGRRAGRQRHHRRGRHRPRSSAGCTATTSTCCTCTAASWSWPGPPRATVRTLHGRPRPEAG